MTATAERLQRSADRRNTVKYHNIVRHSESLLRPHLIRYFDAIERYYLREYTKIIRELYTARGIPVRKQKEPQRVWIGSKVPIGATDEAQQNIAAFNSVLDGVAAAAMRRGYAEAPIKGVVFGAGFDIGQEAFRRTAWINRYKGLDAHTSNRIDTLVQAGVRDGLPLGKIRSTIRSEFAKVKGWKANLIIRSETTRYQNAGLLAGYDANPLIGAKRWVATLDKFTRRWHRSQPMGVHGQIRLLDEYYDVPGHGQQLFPSECNCRCLSNSVKDPKQIKKAYKRAGRPYPRDGLHRPVNAAMLPPNEHFAHGNRVPEFNAKRPVGLSSGRSVFQTEIAPNVLQLIGAV